jgi:hypothetical protein
LGFSNTGKTEHRHSEGRGKAMTCALYEKSLADSDEPGVEMTDVPTFSIRQHFERLQAA